MQGLTRGLQALRGVAHISAVTIAAELGNISSRFETARKLMGYSGAFPSEDSSGNRIRRAALPRPATRPQAHRGGIGLMLSTPAPCRGKAA